MLRKLHISISGATSAVANAASNKFNKKGWVAITFDDGSPGHIKATQVFDNLSFTDGCGNSKRYSLGVALNAGTGEPGDLGYDANYLQKPALDAVIAKRGDLENHGFYHGDNGNNPQQDLERLHNQILLRVGYKMGLCVVPSNFLGFGNAAYLKGYDGVTSQGDATFDQFQPVRVHRTWPPLADPYQFLAVVRDFQDEWQDSAQVDYLKSECAKILTGERNFEIIGTHSVLENDPKLAGFTSLFTYIHDTLGDEVGVCTLREMLDYKRMQVMPFNQSFSDGVLSIEIDVQDPDATLRWEDISFNIVTDGTITGVTKENFEATSFNASSKLVNAFQDNTSFDDQPVYKPLMVKKGIFTYNNN